MKWTRAGARRAASIACLALGLAHMSWLGARPGLASARRFADEHGALHRLHEVRTLRWRAPELLPPSALEPAPLRKSYSPDGRWCVYEARGAAGDLDLYLAERLADGALARAEALHELNSAADECDPAFGTSEPLELHFASSRPGGAGGFDLYVADFALGRAGPVRAQRELNSAADELDPAPLPERGGARRIVLSSNRERAQRPGAVDHDLYLWSAPADLAQPPRLEALEALNGPLDEREPAALAGGTRLLFSTQITGEHGDAAQHELALAYEEPAEGAWRWLGPRLLAELNTGGDERAPLPLGAGFELEFARGSASADPDGAIPAFETFRASAHELRALPPPWPSLLEVLGALLLIAIGLCGLLLRGPLHPLTRFLIASWIAHLLLLLWLRHVEVGRAAPLERESDEAIEIELEALPDAGEPYPLEARALSEPSAPNEAEAARAELAALEAQGAPERAAASDWRSALEAANEVPSAPQRSDAPLEREPLAEAELALRAPEREAPPPAADAADARALDALEPLARAPERAEPAPSLARAPSEPERLEHELSDEPSARAPSDSLAEALRELEQASADARSPERESASSSAATALAAAEPELELRADRPAPRSAPAADARAHEALGPLASAPARVGAAQPMHAPHEPAVPAAAQSTQPRAPTSSDALARSLHELERSGALAQAPERASATSNDSSARSSAEPRLELRAERAAPPTARAQEPRSLESALAAPLARAPENAPLVARTPSLAEPARERAPAAPSPLAPLAPREPAPIPGLEDIERAASADRASAAPPREQLSPYRARSGPERAIALRQGGGGAQTERAVAAGLRYLARMQRAGGHWGDERALDAKYGRTVVGKTGLCLLAFLGAGHLPGGESEHAATAARALDALLAWQSPVDGHFGESEAYGHGIATLALAECYALGREERLRAPLERAIARIVAAQDTSGDPRRDGGFGYYGRDGAADDGWPRSAISAWQTMALASARLAGLEGLDAPLERARAFLLRARGNDGVYRYNHDPRRLASIYPTLPASTPASLFALALSGEDLARPEHARALDYVLQRAPGAYERASEAEFVARAAGHPYFWYAGTLALFRAGGERWGAWNAALQRCLLPAQAEDGSWEPIDAYARYAGDSDADRSYTTALCVLTLEVYYRYLTPVLRAQ